VPFPPICPVIPSAYLIVRHPVAQDVFGQASGLAA
jgi:hypothetical protein